MIDIELPKPIIKTKSYNPDVEKQGLEAGLHPVIARVLASRPLSTDLPLLQALSPKLKHLSLPSTMADMGLAAERVANAVITGECIGIETDHDCDGQTSHAVLYHNLVKHFRHPPDKIRSYIGHRLKEGYGLSESVATRILEDSPRPSVVITADNGSSDEPRIARLKAVGIDVVITDHHEIPKEGYPKSAYACLNPTRPDCNYNDPFVAGCMVAWLLMTATRQKLIEYGHLPNYAPTLLDSLDFVAVGTIADCVSIARSINNRAVVTFGLKLIEKGTRPCWRAIKSDIKGIVNSEDLGFKIAPLLNSDGRLSSALGSVSFLLAETDEEAMAWVYNLQDQNTMRKSIQQDIVSKGLLEAKQQVDKGRASICIYLEEGHTGVHGIAASRIKDIFGRPTAFFAPKVGMHGLITGSVRGIENFHVREALQTVANHYPTILISFGGHKGAGGLTLKKIDFAQFSEAFEKATRLQVGLAILGPVVWTEGQLALEHLTLKFLDSLSVLEPFGREFEAPIFELIAEVKEIRIMGDGTHARVQLKSAGVTITGVWFKMRKTKDSPIPIQQGDTVKVAFTLKGNIFREQRSLDIHVVHMDPSF